jgi:hypothetical protein
MFPLVSSFRQLPRVAHSLAIKPMAAVCPTARLRAIDAIIYS